MSNASTSGGTSGGTSAGTSGDTSTSANANKTTVETHVTSTTVLIDPHQILGIGPGAAPGQVLAAAARAMRERRHPIHDIAAAQRELLDPARRAMHDFVQTVDLAPLLAGLPPLEPAPPAGRPAPPALVCLDLGPDAGVDG